MDYTCIKIAMIRGEIGLLKAWKRGWSIGVVPKNDIKTIAKKYTKLKLKVTK